MKYLSRYILHDLVVNEAARFLSNENGHAPWLSLVGDHPGYDLRNFEGNKSYEVKTDTSTSRTSNCAIEFKNTDTNLPSGIEVTTASHFLYLALTPSGGWVAVEYDDIPKLRDVANKYGAAKHCARNSMCWIVPLKDFCQHATRVIPWETQFHEQLIKSAGGPRWHR